MSTCTTAPQSDAVSPLHRWLAIVVLAVATFTIVVTEFAPIGLLSSIAGDLHERPATVGLIVSAYAWIGAGSALLSAVLPNHFPAKPLLIGLMLLLAASSGVSAVAPVFPALMLARIAGALAHGIFWAMVAALATQIAPRDRIGVATAVVFGGISIASVLGVPLVNVIGQHWDWRVAFGLLSGLSLLTALLMAAALPTIRAEGAVGGKALAGVLRNRALWVAYAVAIFTVAAHFGAFTFIEPYLRQMPGVAPSAVAPLLFAFGAAGLLGNVLTGLAIDRHFKLVIVAALVFMCAALIGLGWLVPRTGIATAVACLLAWGAAISALFVGIQTWVLRAGGAAAIPASALYTTVFNGASGVGAMAGAAILARTGLSDVMLAAGGGVACATVVVAAAARGRVSRSPA